jgi:hypothetical protein
MSIPNSLKKWAQKMLKASFRQKTLRILSYSRFSTFSQMFLLITFSEDFDLLWNQHKFLRFVISLVEILTITMTSKHMPMNM